MTSITTAEIAEARKELETLEEEYHTETDPVRQTRVREQIADTTALLTHLIYADGRAGEDFTNDTVFHSETR